MDYNIIEYHVNSLKTQIESLNKALELEKQKQEKESMKINQEILEYHEKEEVYDKMVETLEKELKNKTKAEITLDYLLNSSVLKEDDNMKFPKNKWIGKHYHSIGNRWVVSKSINGRQTYYGRYELKEDAQNIVRELEKVNWDKKQLPDLQEKICKGEVYTNLNRRGAKNYRFANGRWFVYKMIDYKTISYGVYKSEEIAKRVVELLRMVDWDKKELPYIKRELELQGYEL